MSLKLRVCSVRRATPSTRIVRVELAGEAFGYLPGQAVLLGSPDDSLRVPYSVASAPAESERGGYLEFLTRLDPESRLRDVKRGTMLAVSGPVGSFVLPREPAADDLLFVAGGTGIAPLRSMIMEAVLTRQHKRLRLLYSARTPRDFAYLPDLRRLARNGHLELALTATREVPPRWRGGRGRISRDQLAPLLATPETLSFVCGPVAMVDDVPRILAELGVEKTRIRLEEWEEGKRK